MNARERLERITQQANDKGHVLPCSDNDAAALLELDQLIEGMVKICGDKTIGANDYWLLMNEWLERAEQAGYGEK